MDGDFKKGTHRGEDMYEMNGFIVHYFSENKIKSLLNGFINISIEKSNNKIPIISINLLRVKSLAFSILFLIFIKNQIYHFVSFNIYC